MFTSCTELAGSIPFNGTTDKTYARGGNDGYLTTAQVQITFRYLNYTGGEPQEGKMGGMAGTTIQLPEPTDNGYTFGGWYTTASCSAGTAVKDINELEYGDPNYDGTYMLQDSTTLYAKRSLNSYYISYALTPDTTNPAANVNTEDGRYRYNTSTPSLTLQPPTRPGYEFTGWTITLDGEGATNVNAKDSTTPTFIFGTADTWGNLDPDAQVVYRVELHRQPEPRLQRQRADQCGHDHLSGVLLGAAGLHA